MEMRPDTARVRRHELGPALMLRLASDQRLVEQVRAGSGRAFETLFERYHRPLLSFCRHMLHSREDAEDALQQTFLAAYRDLTCSEGPIVLRPWLYGIARHRCLWTLRVRHERPVESLPESGSDHLAAEIATRVELRAILADIARLPEDQRAALVLAEFGDRSHDEIAHVLDCPPRKVKALVFQARAALASGRTARETSCAEIREQLVTLRGGALRRATLRRHLQECAGCRAFHEQVRVRRRARGLLWPVAPIVSAKRAVVSAVFSSGGGSAGGGLLAAGGLSGSGLAATVAVLTAIPVGGIAVAATASLNGSDAATTRARIEQHDAAGHLGARPLRTHAAIGQRTALEDGPADAPTDLPASPRRTVPPTGSSSPESRPADPAPGQSDEPPQRHGETRPARSPGTDTEPDPGKDPAGSPQTDGDSPPARPSRPNDGSKPATQPQPSNHGEPRPSDGPNPATPPQPANPSHPAGGPNPADPPQTLAQPKPATPPQSSDRPRPASPSRPEPATPPQPNDHPRPASPPRPERATPGSQWESGSRRAVASDATGEPDRVPRRPG
jgi:RNA polymerase sigma factor (sigma-70 family)